MPDHDDKTRDIATNKLLNILRAESPEGGKSEKPDMSAEEKSGDSDIDSKKLTALFDQTASQKKGKTGKEAFEDDQKKDLDRDQDQDQVQDKDKDKDKDKEQDQDLAGVLEEEKRVEADRTPGKKQKSEVKKESGEREKTGEAEKTVRETEPDNETDVEADESEGKPSEEDSAEEKEETPISLKMDGESDKIPEEAIISPDEEAGKSEETTPENILFSDSEDEPESDRIGPFVEFKKRFETKETPAEETEESVSPEEKGEEDEAESGDSLLTFLENQPEAGDQSEEEGSAEAAGMTLEDEKSSRDGKSIFDLLDEYIATKNDDIVLPIKESETLPTEPVPPKTETKKSEEGKEEGEEPVKLEKEPPIPEEEEKTPKSATQKVIYEDLEKESSGDRFDDLGDEEEGKVFEEKFNSIQPAVKLKISEISDWLDDKRKIAIVETDESSARYLTAVPEVNKIKITNWGHLNYWNFPDDATDEDKHKFALRTISRQVKHKKSFLTFFTHSRNYVSRVQSFQKLSNKETQEAISWAVNKNLPFPDKAIEYDVKQISSDSVDEKSYLTLIAPQKQVAQQEKYFRDVGMNPRQITTVSYLAAKAFRLNYPDYFKETAIIFYMGESYSNLIFIKNHEFHYEREFSIGRKDLLTALNQEVSTLNGTRKLSSSDALLLLDTYGFSRRTKGVIESLGIDYSRYSIMIRPIAERIIMEITRSVDYYRKTFSLLADGDIFLVGPGAVIPGTARFIEDQLGRKTSILNPMRTDIFGYKYKDAGIPDKLLPCYTLHLAASFPEKDLNVITKSTRSREPFIAGSKLTRLLLVLFILFAGIRTNDLMKQQEVVRENYSRAQTRWKNVSEASSTFMTMSDKESTLTDIMNQIRMDQYSTDRTLTFLKMISNLTPSGIHLIDFQLNKNTGGGENNPDFILKGYITRNPSVADIYLNNYLSKFKETGFFESISLKSGDEKTDDGLRRTFTISGVLKPL